MVLLQVFGLGPGEILVVVVLIILLILGPKKIPELFHALGKSTGEFKKGVKESEEEMKESKAKKAKKKKKEEPEEEE
jgi:sec-independent protein translocase protein TatA